MSEVLLLSVDEPQLPRSLMSIRDQTIPFSNLVHVNNMVPHSKAYNHGVRQLTDDWFLLTAGDVYLYSDAAAKCIEVIKDTKDEKVIFHSFNLYDTFMESNWGGIGIFRRDVYQTAKIRDRLKNDGKLFSELSNGGWKALRHECTIGEHFSAPNRFQVFRRFYVVGLKYGGVTITQFRRELPALLKKTGNPLYQNAIDAMEFGRKKRAYPGSHNIDFEKKMYEEFNALQT